MQNSNRVLWAILGGLLTSAYSQATPPQSSGALDLALAGSMGERCFNHPVKNGWPPFSIAIVDAGGALLDFRRQDGASTVTAEAAVMKARTSARVAAPTGALVAMSQDPPTRDLFLLLQLTDDPGGIPLRHAGHLIGAIGVSGGTAEQDIGCANLAASVLGD